MTHVSRENRRVRYSDIHFSKEDMEKVLARDPSSYEKLRTVCYDLASVISREKPSTLEDITQQVMLKLLEKSLESYDPSKDNPKSWLSVLVRNTYIDMDRKKNRREGSVPHASLEKEHWSNPALNLRTILEDKKAVLADQALQESDPILQDALNKLPPFVRDAVIARHMRQLSFEQIAASEDIPLGTAKSRVNRGLNLLKDYYKKQSEKP